MNTQHTFSLDSVDSDGIFFYAGIRKGQIIGLMAPHLITKYMKLIPVYKTSNVHPDYLRDKVGNRYGFCYSASETFDLSNSYELGFGRHKNGTSAKMFDRIVFLNYKGKSKFVANVVDADIVLTHMLPSKKVNIAHITKATG